MKRPYVACIWQGSTRRVERHIFQPHREVGENERARAIKEDGRTVQNVQGARQQPVEG